MGLDDQIRQNDLLIKQKLESQKIKDVMSTGNLSEANTTGHMTSGAVTTVHGTTAFSLARRGEDSLKPKNETGHWRNSSQV